MFCRNAGIWAIILLLARFCQASEPLVVACPLKPDPPPNVDGDRREWDHLPGEIEIGEKQITWGKPQWSGPEDLSGLVQMCYDANYLYILAEVQDDQVTIGGGREMFSRDHLELTFAPEYEAGTSGAMEKNWRIIGFSPGTLDPSGDFLSDLEPEAFLHTPINTDSSSIDVASSPQENGFLLEVRIPWSILGVKGTPKTGDVFGFDLHFSDSDSGTTQETLTSLNQIPWKGRKKEHILKLQLTGTDGKLPR